MHLPSLTAPSWESPTLPIRKPISCKSKWCDAIISCACQLLLNCNQKSERRPHLRYDCDTHRRGQMGHVGEFHIQSPMDDIATLPDNIEHIRMNYAFVFNLCELGQIRQSCMLGVTNSHDMPMRRASQGSKPGLVVPLQRFINDIGVSNSWIQEQDCCSVSLHLRCPWSADRKSFLLLHERMSALWIAKRRWITGCCWLSTYEAICICQLCMIDLCTAALFVSNHFLFIQAPFRFIIQLNLVNLSKVSQDLGTPC